jgi:hypothetical protein
MARPKRVNLGIRTILGHVSENATSHSARAAPSGEEQKRLAKIARLSKELLEEIDQLSEMEPKPK